MKHTNIYKFPDALVAALTHDDYDNEGSDASVTGLIQPPRIFQLKKRHGDKVVVDVSDEIWKVLGQATHYVLQNSGGKGTVEKRFFASVLGWKISGQADYYENMILDDYKITSVWAVKDSKFEWEAQLNMLKCLMGYNGEPINILRIVAILKDWKWREAGRDGYPAAAAVVVPVEMWPEEKTEQYIHERVKLHQQHINTPDDELPPCTKSERWEPPTKFAVMKGKNKRATRVLDTHQAALNHIDEKNLDMNVHYIEERTGVPMRCEKYCSINQFCNQYMKEED